MRWTRLAEDGAEGELVCGEHDVVGAAAAAPRKHRQAARRAVGKGPIAQIHEELGVWEPHAPRQRQQHLVGILLEALPPAAPAPPAHSETIARLRFASSKDAGQCERACHVGWARERYPAEAPLEAAHTERKQGTRWRLLE